VMRHLLGRAVAPAVVVLVVVSIVLSAGLG
jgi:hypothetical protein